MAARITKELEEARRWDGARELRPLGGNVLRWGGLLLPNNPPYNTGAFRFELTFSPHHPLAPPRATLCTSIYHPGVDRQGNICQPLTSPEHWEPTTRAVQGGQRGVRDGGHGRGGLPPLTPPLPPQCCRICCSCWRARTPSGCCGRIWPGSSRTTPRISCARQRSTPAAMPSPAMAPPPPETPRPGAGPGIAPSSGLGHLFLSLHILINFLTLQVWPSDASWGWGGQREELPPPGHPGGVPPSLPVPSAMAAGPCQGCVLPPLLAPAAPQILAWCWCPCAYMSPLEGQGHHSRAPPLLLGVGRVGAMGDSPVLGLAEVWLVVAPRCPGQHWQHRGCSQPPPPSDAPGGDSLGRGHGWDG
uniref:UBC core domain-containing protein n=1 Tax=Calidris pygmaea TaxID=425635 RepID=A0A8C3J894_9CHAR